jgi:MoaA/NifB/PqqE/SkfB family radical SAM enzyme
VDPVWLKKRARKTSRRIREARMLVQAFRHQYRPVAVHLIPIRRCNLSCQYCNEYDDHSSPVPTSEVLRRIDRLADLGAGIVTLSGGEPLLHPDLDEIIRRIRGHRLIATLITNGYLLTRDRIRRLNRAGLDHLQISIDNIIPDEVSKKSLKVLDQKLRWLSEDAEFDVTVNSVVGSGVKTPEDALTVTHRARALGFSTTVGILHDGSGQLVALGERARKVLDDIVTSGTSVLDYANYNRFQTNLANGQANDWQCRAGARYLYVCEEGLVHWCSQQRGHPGTPLETYSVEDLRREYHRAKGCAPHCTVGCVHRVAQVDELRQNPQAALAQWFAPSAVSGRSSPPPAIKLLVWAFVTSPHRGVFRTVAQRVLGSEPRV